MNKLVRDRLEAIQLSLIAHHKGGAGLPNAVIGKERENLINDYLSEVLPNLYRFGSGAITDSSGNSSGQLDVIIELPFSSNFPMPAGKERLYLAESVAAVIEVKSNLYNQWDEVIETTRKIKTLNRALRHSSGLLLEESPDPLVVVTPKIPCYAVGYTGYKSLEGLTSKISSVPEDCRPDGILVIDSGCFVGVTCKANGVWGLYYLVAELLEQTNAVMGIAYPNILDYV